MYARATARWNAVRPSAFIAKSEVRGWPFIGWLSARHDTIFLRRGSHGHARDINAEIEALLHVGRDVALFPEGKTSNGEAVDTFHGNMLQAAIVATCPVQAVALDYRLAATGARSTAVSYASPLNFAQSLINTLASGPYVARLQFAPSLPTQGRNRKHLAEQLRQQIVQMRA